MIQDYYQFLWALNGVLAWFVTVLIQVYGKDRFKRSERKKTRLRDKLHFAHSQNRGAT